MKEVYIRVLGHLLYASIMHVVFAASPPHSQTPIRQIRQAEMYTVEEMHLA